MSNVANQSKRELYRTAIARIACSLFKAGDVVSVKYIYRASNGVHWYQVGKGEANTAYPENHLHSFVL